MKQHGIIVSPYVNILKQCHQQAKLHIDLKKYFRHFVHGDSRKWISYWIIFKDGDHAMLKQVVHVYLNKTQNWEEANGKNEK